MAKHVLRHAKQRSALGIEAMGSSLSCAGKETLLQLPLV